MDASSIITQVSRDDEICAFNSEKGAYRVLTRCHPPPCACKLLRQMLPGFVSLHLLRYPHPRFSPRPTSSPNFTSCRSSLPLPCSANNIFACLRLASHLLLFSSSTLSSPINPSSSRSCVSCSISQIFLFFHIMLCPLTLYAL